MNGVGTKLFTVLVWIGSLELALAGNSGLNVVVVVNQFSTNSVQLGNCYCERRAVPPQNFLRINWPGGNTEWTKGDFETHLFSPLTNLLAMRGLTSQADLVVLSMDIPYRVVHSGGATNSGKNSTTSVLFYGFQPDTAPPAGLPVSCSLPAASENAYAASEEVFRDVVPAAGGTNFLAFMITTTNLAEAKAIVDRGVISDSSFPTQAVFLTKSTDTARNVRYVLFDDAVMDNLVLGRVRLVRTNTYTPDVQGLQLGSANGSYAFTLRTNLFVPGAMADNLTSFGGWLFEDAKGMTRIPEFLAAGATASYGTVVEPCNWLQKFPSPQVYLYQARGFSIAESYYQSVANPFQGLLVGEPLAAPFAVRASGGWLGLPANAVLSGTTNLLLQFSTANALRPVRQVDLFVDGQFRQTLTNIAPSPDNVLSVIANAHAMSYTVPAGASLKSVADGLAAEINLAENTNATGIRAFAHGDRIELQFTELERSGSQVALAAGSAPGNAPALTTFLTAARTNFLDTVAWGRRAFNVANAAEADSYLQLSVTKTNGSLVMLSVTNAPDNTNGTSGLVQALVNAINTNADLISPVGLVAEDVITYADPPYGEFNLRARTVGWPASQLTVALTGSTNFALTPTNALRLDENLHDLRPRNHLYVTAGVTNLPLVFALDTTALADGFHELTAIAYEGSHVRTQTRLTQSVRVTNSPLAATFTTLFGGSNTLVTATLQFTVTANTSAVSRIELFSTGGLLAGATNQAAATFNIAGTNLDLGLHPFYALVTSDDGRQYRTETRWIRLVGADFVEPPFKLSASFHPLALTWPATVGRTYEVLSTTNLAAPFDLRAAFAASNSPATWPEPDAAEMSRFYRVRAVP